LSGDCNVVRQSTLSDAARFSSIAHRSSGEESYFSYKPLMILSRVFAMAMKICRTLPK
jgi:hypothetical protein